jgi:chemotaxis protein MotB
VTFADMLCLLLVLFIILYATANQDLAKFEALSQSLAEGFGATMPSQRGSSQGGTPISDSSGGGTQPTELFPENQIPIQIFEFERSLQTEGGADGSLLRDIRDIVERAAFDAGSELQGLKADVQVSVNERGIRISIFPDQILFESGSAILKQSFKEILDQLSAALAVLPNQIEIQGHTDNIPINTATYPSNWELSAGRAGSVIRHMATRGIKPHRLQAAGYADTRPLESNTTREGRARNRRVEIVILRGSLGADPPQPVSSSDQTAASAAGNTGGQQDESRIHGNNDPAAH